MEVPMRIVIAHTVEDVRQFVEAVNAQHIALLAGGNAPSGGFARPADRPTFGYARLHWAKPDVIIDGVHVGQRKDHVVVCGEKIPLTGLPALVEFGGEAGAWRIAGWRQLGGLAHIEAATREAEAAYVGDVLQPGDDPAEDEPPAADDDSGSDPVPDVPTSPRKPARSSRKRRD